MIYKPSNRLRDAALIVPVGGVVLFLPPYVRIFDQDGTVLGIPFLHVALFTCWLIGIVLTALLARLLIRSAAADDDETVDPIGDTDHGSASGPAAAATPGGR